MHVDTLAFFRFRAASPELQEDENSAGRKPPRPARQALKLSKKRRPAKLDVTSSICRPPSAFLLHYICNAHPEVPLCLHCLVPF